MHTGQEQGPKGRNRNGMRATMKLLLAVALLLGVCAFVDVQELVTALRHVSAVGIFYLALIGVLMIWVSCIKWQLFLSAYGHRARILRLMRLYTIGYFINTFTPSFIGGDVVRSVHLGRDLASRRDAFVSTFLERFTGLLAMALLGALFVAVGSTATAGVEAAVLCVALATFALALVCFSQRAATLAFSVLSRSSAAFLPPPMQERLAALLEKLERAFRAARSNPGLLLRAMALSFVYHVLTVLNTYVAARCVGWEDPGLGGLFVVVPLVLLVGMVPITPSGIGLQEGAFLFFLQRIGATEAQALGVGLVLRAKVFVIALVGWLLWITLSTETRQHSEPNGPLQEEGR